MGRSQTLVSVVMPLFNRASYVAEAAESILGQSFKDFEFIIIDDGSTDGSRDVVEAYARHDQRIRLVCEEHKGVIAALNRGIELATGAYVARMDSDDISHADRLERQVAVMERAPAIGICGTWIRRFGAEGRGVLRLPARSEEIRARLLFSCVIAHPTVMMRREAVQNTSEVYRCGYGSAEDYDLWGRISRHWQMVNIPKALLFYRVHEKQTVRLLSQDAELGARRVREDLLAMLGVTPSKDERDLHEAISSNAFQDNVEYMERAEAWLCKLSEANERSCLYDRTALQEVLLERWCAVCSAASSLGMSTLRKRDNSPLWRNQEPRWKGDMLFRLHCLTRSRRLRFWKP